jgi:hypothetical protein
MLATLGDFEANLSFGRKVQAGIRSCGYEVKIKCQISDGPRGLDSIDLL